MSMPFSIYRNLAYQCNTCSLGWCPAHGLRPWHCDRLCSSPFCLWPQSSDCATAHPQIHQTPEWRHLFWAICIDNVISVLQAIRKFIHENSADTHPHPHLAAYPSDAKVTSSLVEIFIRNVISVLQVIWKSIHNTVTHTHTQAQYAPIQTDVHAHLLCMHVHTHTNML